MADLKSKVATLRSISNKLEAKMAEFLVAQWIAEGGIKEEPEPVADVQAAVPQPVVKIKAARLPKFTGSKRDFYSWCRDWGNLQRQGDPFGSAEATKL